MSTTLAAFALQDGAIRASPNKKGRPDSLGPPLYGVQLSTVDCRLERQITHCDPQNARLGSG
jgi:hypothetical protein